ncbi:GTPase HflX [Novibacillus thermophilus]|uniref:GTPase HflX n=1 Tax=Novibacillus thermophilus TaxID=1471761 RepID=A0A1U9K4K5_9BACL|nr:GTPase HflX [Novibacillus thermophilus]AQS54953.1 GTPase HflX [Novibacillus thermophilus]
MAQQKDRQRTFLVGLETKSPATGWSASESLDELARLIDTAGGTVVGRDIQKLNRPDSATYIGRGKAEELHQIAQEAEVDLIVFDGELSPVQQRNLEAIVQCVVIDRTAVILDIFALRARSREAKLQVELAQLNYMLPRMTGRGVDLSRLGGGIGTRGPGETKLEVDRRKIRNRIANVKKELLEVKAHRARLRQSRASQPLPVVALTGYTNAGKSTLHRALAGSDVLAENRLFATFDATTRRVDPPNGEPFLLVDTVGFIHKLPTFLVAAFRSTLEEVKEADLLLHVVDAGHPKRDEQMETVQSVLDEIGAANKPMLLVYNKWDQMAGSDYPHPFRQTNTVAVSALTGENMDALQHAIQQALSARRVTVEVTIPFDKTEWVSWIFDHGRMLAHQHRLDGTYIKVELEKNLANKLSRQLKDM